MFFKNLTFSKKIFFLKNKIKWSGGRSWGKKVFRGQVGTCSSKKFLFLIDRYNSVRNTKGIIQNVIKIFRYNFMINLIFYPYFGVFLYQNSEDASQINNSVLSSSLSSEFYKKGDTTVISNLDTGLILFNLQLIPKGKQNVARSSGTYLKIIWKEEKNSLVLLPSGIYYLVSNECKVTIGLSAWIKWSPKKKAGESRWWGNIPKVWGIAMNPVDHPHGGWTNGGKHPRTPKGFLTKGVKTWKINKWSNKKIFYS